MTLQWENLLRTTRSGRPVRIIWAADFPHLFEIHVPLQGNSNLYVDGRFIAAGNDIISLADQAQKQCEALKLGLDVPHN
ncbi:hypothetical protein [Camelimonas lactis]|uniref:Uncharacterized protein n=1 Tax=Camelimonas lactis TaxID=659006 RepID=A0A4R2GT60_9HYPH|nr:hypothetical protein [Camelimonas lactis]TCO13367.1 hypothetical protein EV666_10677 [Camelimonas lactis]